MITMEGNWMKVRLTQSQSRTALAVLVTTILVLSISHSLFIAGAFAIFIAIFLTIALNKSESRRSAAIEAGCPELIDILISGVQSGLSLNESLIGLSNRGPEVLRPHFSAFREGLYAHGDFNRALLQLQDDLSHPNIDLILEALRISKALGGAELLNILRLLGNFIREDLTLRREIAVKHNWIRNSAHLSAGAPWILLLLLSTQPSTAAAFSNFAGISILVAGLALTAIAYLWMNKLSQLPTAHRIFFSAELSELR
jgi:tight adherence protein B